MKSGIKLGICIISLLAALSVVASCTSKPPATTPATSKPAATTQAPATSKPAATTAAATTQAPATSAAPFTPMKLKISDYGTKREQSAGYEWWADQVTKQTNGAITFEFYYSELISPASQQYVNMKAGLFDLALLSASFNPAHSPMWNFNSLPAMGEDHIALAKAQAEVSALPEMTAELAQWNAKYLFTCPLPTYAYMGKVPITKVEDFKGVKIRTVGYLAQMVSALGGVPVNTTLGETYEAIDRGTVQGVCLTTTSFGTYGIFDVAKNYSLVGFGALGPQFCVNTVTWNKLDPRVQKIMLDTAAKVPDQFKKIYDDATAKWIAKFKESKVNFNDFPASERQRVTDIAKNTVWEPVITDLEKKGSTAIRKVIEAYWTAYNKYATVK